MGRGQEFGKAGVGVGSRESGGETPIPVDPNSLSPGRVTASPSSQKTRAANETFNTPDDARRVYC